MVFVECGPALQGWQGGGLRGRRQAGSARGARVAGAPAGKDAPSTSSPSRRTARAPRPSRPTQVNSSPRGQPRTRRSRSGTISAEAPHRSSARPSPVHLDGGLPTPLPASGSGQASADTAMSARGTCRRLQPFAFTDLAGLCFAMPVVLELRRPHLPPFYQILDLRASRCANESAGWP